MLKELTETLMSRKELSFEQARQAVDSILSGNAAEASIAGFLTALACKGEQPDEVAGMASSLREHAIRVNPQSRPVLDIVGTGGDGRSTFNISTTAALVLAGAGVKVAKHGNRAITSTCGAADLLAALGVKLDASPATIARCIDEAGIGFMFAPMHHPAMKFVQPIRKALGFRTAFNILGPLANPAFAEYMVVGVARESLLHTMAGALQRLGVTRALVVCGDGTDEFVLSGKNHVVELNGAETRLYGVDGVEYGLARCSFAALTTSSVEQNVKITRGILDGSIRGGLRDTILLNAAAALYIYGRCPSIQQGIPLAGEAIDSGRAAEALSIMVTISNS